MPTRKVGWVNEIVAHLWPYICQHIKERIEGDITTAIREAVPAPFKSISFSKSDLGPTPFKLLDIEIVKTENPMNLDFIQLHLPILYEGEADIALKLAFASAGAKSITFSGTLTVIAGPLIAEPPFVAAMQLLFFKQPHIDADFTGLGNIIDLPGIENKTRDIFKAQISKTLVFPNRYVLPLCPAAVEVGASRLMSPLQAATSYISFPPPSSMLRMNFVALENASQLVDSTADNKQKFVLEFSLGNTYDASSAHRVIATTPAVMNCYDNTLRAVTSDGMCLWANELWDLAAENLKKQYLFVELKAASKDSVESCDAASLASGFLSFDDILKQATQASLQLAAGNCLKPCCSTSSILFKTPSRVYSKSDRSSSTREHDSTQDDSTSHAYVPVMQHSQSNGPFYSPPSHKGDGRVVLLSAVAQKIHSARDKKKSKEAAYSGPMAANIYVNQAEQFRLSIEELDAECKENLLSGNGGVLLLLVMDHASGNVIGKGCFFLCKSVQPSTRGNLANFFSQIFNPDSHKATKKRRRDDIAFSPTRISEAEESASAAIAAAVSSPTRSASVSSAALSNGPASSSVEKMLKPDLMEASTLNEFLLAIPEKSIIIGATCGEVSFENADELSCSILSRACNDTVDFSNIVDGSDPFVFFGQQRLDVEEDTVVNSEEDVQRELGGEEAQQPRKKSTEVLGTWPRLVVGASTMERSIRLRCDSNRPVYELPQIDIQTRLPLIRIPLRKDRDHHGHDNYLAHHDVVCEPELYMTLEPFTFKFKKNTLKIKHNDYFVAKDEPKDQSLEEEEEEELMLDDDRDLGDFLSTPNENLPMLNFQSPPIATDAEDKKMQVVDAASQVSSTRAGDLTSIVAGSRAASVTAGGETTTHEAVALGAKPDDSLKGDVLSWLSKLNLYERLCLDEDLLGPDKQYAHRRTCGNFATEFSANGLVYKHNPQEEARPAKVACVWVGVNSAESFIMHTLTPGRKYYPVIRLLQRTRRQRAVSEHERAISYGQPADESKDCMFQVIGLCRGSPWVCPRQVDEFPSTSEKKDLPKEEVTCGDPLLDKLLEKIHLLREYDMSFTDMESILEVNGDDLVLFAKGQHPRLRELKNPGWSCGAGFLVDADKLQDIVVSIEIMDQEIIEDLMDAEDLDLLLQSSSPPALIGERHMKAFDAATDQNEDYFFRLGKGSLGMAVAPLRSLVHKMYRTDEKTDEEHCNKFCEVLVDPAKHGEPTATGGKVNFEVGVFESYPCRGTDSVLVSI